VARVLTDGRSMVVEYKGALLEGKASEQAKRDIGREWERRSAGQALFLWALIQDPEHRNVAAQIKSKIKG
jgi:type III restriction enzyme